MPVSTEELLNLKIEKESILRKLGTHTYRKGEEILKHRGVIDVSVDQVSIVGIVQGTNPKPYRQNIILADSPTQSIGDTYCSCPVGNDCKHVAAVLLKLADERKEALARVGPHAPKDGEYTPSYEVVTWVNQLLDSLEPLETDYAPDAPQKARYLLDVSQDGRYDHGLNVKLTTVRLLKNGSYGDSQPFKMPWIESEAFPRYVLQADRPLIQTIHRVCHRAFVSGYGQPHYRLHGGLGIYLLRRLIQTGRLFWNGHQEPLSLAEPRKAKPVWTEGIAGLQKFGFEIEGGGVALPLVPLWFIDTARSLIGEAVCDLPASVLNVMLDSPDIEPEAANYVHTRLARSFPNIPEIAPVDKTPPTVRIISPEPIVQIFNVDARQYGRGRPTKITLGRLSFRYEDMKVRSTSDKKEIRVSRDGNMTIYPRNQEREHAYTRRFEGCGWTMHHFPYEVPSGNDNDYMIEARKTLSDPIVDFIQSEVPRLESEGWQFIYESGVVGERLPEPEWDFALEEQGGIDWFGIQLGATVGAEHIDLAPVLARVLAVIRARGGLRVLKEDGEPILIRLDDGRILPLAPARVKPLLETLVQLYGEPDQWSELKKLPKWRLLDFEMLERATHGVSWRGSERLKEIAEGLSKFSGVWAKSEPAGFVGELREYQKNGVAWLQFLSEFNFGGILADDMGLGKTVQTLAHLLHERHCGRADLPCLLVAPTSTLPNWLAEAAKFAPDLKVCMLHGADRKKRFKEIDGANLVVTTYNLLARDKDEILKHKYHLLVLDEAQNVKNPKVAAAYVARQISAKQKVCLSGTPIENHLGELWSLFHIVMPEMLGDEEAFKKRFRTPIEKLGNEPAKVELSRRIRPFLLRRTKSQVASELPPKTEIVEPIEFASAQRDLYETVRSAMDKRVRDALQQQGLARSHIVILDALLKLRQVCCDPRLLKLDAARDLKESAKLERLMEMVPEMLEEGRRILLFSQFTSMLEIIEASLAKDKISFVKLTGETKDRATPVNRFQKKEVPLFLISLKAGGTGLNLTAADTVIHYDLWWNPAVERQATDRAHRIGQDQPVFVYKLIAQGTVEEKILELQQRKAGLADALMDPASQKLEITKEDLSYIFSS